MAKIYQTTNMGEAQLRVALVGRGSADLLVHRVESQGLAHGEASWFITKNKQDATTYVYFTSEGMAQITICFVDSCGEAGWQTRRPRGLRFQ